MPVTHLLRTKFLVPRRKTDHLDRRHLVTRIGEALAQGRLVLLSAPPGYGKTMLLAEFVEQSQNPCAWIQLDLADGDPAIFLSCLIQASRQSVTNYGEELPESGALALLENAETASTVAPERVLALFINEMADFCKSDWTLILEDYHLISNPAVHALVNRLIEQGPANQRIILSSRVDPPLALARFRAHGRISELRAGDLRFSSDELATWLAHSPDLPVLDNASISLLQLRTEGWAAALQIARSSLAGRNPSNARSFLHGLTGAQRHIFEYLADEVFRRQTPALQQFLLYTAVLTQMDAAVCDAVLETTGSQSILEELEQANLFIVSLDEARAWYRYHHLFREFLLARLARRGAAEHRGLNQRAARYYEVQAEWEMALGHHIAARDFDGACRVLTLIAPEYIDRGRTAVLQRSLADIPPAVLNDYPDLLLADGVARLRQGQLAPAVTRFEEARLRFATAEDNHGSCRALTQLAVVAQVQGNHARAQELANEALTCTEPGDHALRAHALMVQARSAGFQADMDVGRALAEEALVAARQAGPSLSPGMHAQLLRRLGHICWWHGDPGATVRFCEEALQVLNDDLSPAAASAYLTMATPFAYWGDTETALRYARQANRIVDELDLADWRPRALASLGAVLSKHGDLQLGEATLRQSIDVARASGVDTYAQMIATGYLASNLSAQNRLEEARQVAETALWIQGGETYHYEMIFCRSVLADIAIAQGRVEEADAIFSSLRPEAERRRFRILLAMIDFGLAYLALGRADNKTALWHARRSFESLEPIGAIQLYLDQGARAAAVCRALAEDGEKSAFISAVLQKLDSPAELETTQTVVQKIPKRILLRTLGDFEVIVDGVCLAQDVWASVKARDLLAYLAHSRRQRLSLEMALEALWPNRESPGKTAFHTALYRLRQVLRSPEDKSKLVLVKGGEYWLDPDCFEIDADRFEHALSKAWTEPDAEVRCTWLQEAVGLYDREYLANLRYYDWANSERRRLSNAFLEALEALASSRLALGDIESALGHARRALAHDPLHEAAHILVMRCHAAAGDRRQLIAQFDLLKTHLADELELEPLPRTSLTYDQLLAEFG